VSAVDRRFGAVTVLGGEKNGKYPDGNSMVVRGRDATLLVDPSLSVWSRGAALGGVDLVVQSHVHEDHLAGLARFPEAAVHAHRADVAGLRDLAGLMAIYGSYATLEAMGAWVEREFHYAPRPDAHPYDDGARFELGGVAVRAIHLPGHTRGHCALLVEPDGVLFLGDIDLSSFGPYYGDAWSSLEDFERSLARVREIPARVWVTFHHVGVIEERAAFLARLARFAARIAEREQALLAYLAAPRTVAEMVAHRFLYPPHAQLNWIDGAERRTIEQHLARLQAAGRVEACAPETWRRIH
jgi:glyoxylase-like metal-dependent hydrolase (beta-lactamase superfamily II)